MNKALSIVLFLSVQMLGGIIAVVAGSRVVGSWYEGHAAILLAVGFVILVACIVLTSKATSAEERKAGEILTSGDLLGAVLSGVVVCTVIGVAIGLVAEWLLPQMLDGLTPRKDLVLFVTFLRDQGALGVACIATGAIVGSRLGYAYPDGSGLLAVAGSVFGACSGIVAEHIYLQTPGMHVLSQPTVRPAVEASALLGAALGGFTGIFKLGHDRRVARSAGAKEESSRAEKADRARADIAIARLAKANLGVISGDFSFAMYNQFGSGLISDDSTPNPFADAMLKINSLGDQLQPPWHVIDRRGVRLRKLGTIEGLEAFANEVDPAGAGASYGVQKPPSSA